jgi:hypothetical protein
MPSIKKVNRISGDWHVQSSNDIYLETKYDSDNLGTVHIYGNLQVNGQTTTIESSDLVINDKILVLNKGESGLSNGATAGVSGNGISGLSIARGGPASPNYNANLFYNQNKSWTFNGVTNSGIWEFYIGPPSGGISSEGHSAIVVNAIRTGTSNTDLSLLGADNSQGTVTVDGVSNYTQRIITRNKDNDIPNKGYVDYAIELQPDRRRIQLNYRTGAGVPVFRNNTYLEFVEQDVPGYPSSGAGAVTEAQLRTSIGGNQWITVFGNRMVIGDIKINDSNEITMETANTRMILSTKPGPGISTNPSIELKTSLSMVIDSVYQAPANESGRVKIYPDYEGPGGTGLFFVNSENVRDELPSKRRAFFASLMF